MSSFVAGPPVVEIHYPEGPPMPEGNLQKSRFVEVAWALRQWYLRRGVEGAWVCWDINLYYREGDPEAVVAPDVAVAFGVDAVAQEPRPTFKVWEAGAAPCFVLEIVSPSTVRKDVRDKPGVYAELGVEEYWRLDPTGGELMDPPLQGERRRGGRWGGRWAPVEVVSDGGGLRARSERLGLDLCWRPPKLRLWDIAARAWVPDPDDEADRADREAARATREAARADQHAARADQHAARADGEAAARRAVEAELAELRARLGRGS